MAKKESLGRGLASIFPEAREAYMSNFMGETRLIEDIDIDQITINPYQHRKEFNEKSLQNLSDPIKQYGLIQPIVEVKNQENQFTLIAGERRLRASKLAQLTTINALVSDFQENDLRKVALIENIQRENLNPIELATAFNTLIEEEKLTQQELAKIIQKSRTYIANILRLLKLSPLTQKALADQHITYGHAKVLVGLPDAEEQGIVQEIMTQNLNVRETEKRSKTYKQRHNKKQVNNNQKAVSINFKDLQDQLLSRNLNYKILGQKLVLTFNSQEEVEKLLKFLK